MRNLDLRWLMGTFVLIGLLLISFGEATAQVTISENFETWSPAQTTTSCTTGTLGAEGGGWTQDQTDGGEWRLDAGGTTSSSTGPSVDYDPGTSSGYYMYTESGSPCYGITCNLISPPVNMTNFSYQLDFAYHMYGAAMGSLSVDVWQDTIWVLDVWTMSGDLGDTWFTASVNLASYSGDSTKIRFRGVTGTSYTSDMAIDAVKLFPLLDNDMAVVDIYPSTICSGQTDFYAIVENSGGNTIFAYDLDWSMDGVAQTGVSVTDSIQAGDMDTILLGNYNFINSTYDVVISVSLPVLTDPNILNDTLTLSPFFLSLNGTYTIGATGNFVDFTAAANALLQYGVCGPVVFEVESGIYNEQITLGEVSGMDATNTVTFKSASGLNTDVVLQNAITGSTDNWVVKLDGGDYYSFKDMTIKSTSTSSSYGVVIDISNGAHNNAFTGNILEGTSGSTSSNTSVVRNYNSFGDSANVFTYNEILNGGYAMYMYSSSYVTGNVISHNIIRDFQYYGIYIRYQDGIEVNYNTISSGQYSTHYGIYTYYVQGPFQFIGNQIHTSATGTNYGMRIYYCDGHPGTGLVANNFISTSVGTSTQYGLYIYYSSNIDFYHNSVNVTNGSATSPACYVYQSSSSGYGNITFANNSFANTGGGYAMYIHDYAMSPGMVTYQDYNNYYATGPTSVLFGVWDASAPADLNLIEPHSVMVDPAYTSVSDLHSYSALLSGAGTPLASVPFDIDMDPRDPLHPNIGADEYTLYTNDAGLFSFIGIDAVCPGPTNVSAQINNFGLVELTEVAVNWTVNGVAQTTLMVYDTIPVGGNTTVLLGNYTFLSGTVYDVVGWTSMPNGVVDLGAYNDSTMSLGLQTAAAGAFTIGATGDFLSITEAQTFISNYGVCGPVVFNIQPGTYTEQVTLEEVSGVDATNTVTWQSSTGIRTDVIVEYTASGLGDNWVWMLDGADYQTVQNITIKSTYPTGSTIYGRVVYIDGGANYNTFHNCVLEGVEGTSTSNYYAVVYNYSTSIDEYNTFSNNDILYGSYAIECYATSASPEYGNKFLNNNVDGYYYYGIRSYYQYDVEIVGNTILQNSNGYSTNYSLYSYYNDGPIKITNNYIYDNAGTTFYGLYINYPDATAAAPGLIANNMVASEGMSGTQYGLRVYNGTNQNIYNNSVNIAQTGGTQYGAYIYMSNATSYGPYNFINNSIVVHGTGTAYALYGYGSGLAGLTSTNNNLYSAGSNLCYFSTYYTDLAAWQAAGFTGDVLNTDGGYLSNSNLHSNSLALDGAALPLAEVPTDIDGEVRDINNPDIGADEFVLANDDAAITGMPGITAVCPGTNNVVATVSNYGLVDLTSVIINWEVNGVLQTPFSYSDTIPVGGAADVLIGTYDMLANTLYSFTVWSSMPNGNNDPNSGNDTLIVSGISTSTFGNFTIGATGDFATFTEAVHYIDSIGICGPVVFDVQTGVYTEQVSIPEIMGASAANTITFRSATGNVNDVTVEWAGTGTTDNWVWRLGGVDWCTVQDIKLLSTFSGSGTFYSRVLVIEGGSDYNNVTNCILEGVPVTSTSNYGAVVYDYYSSGLNNYNTFTDNQILYGSYSWYAYGSGGAYGNKWINNSFTEYYYYGLYAYYQYECEIDGNTIIQDQVNGYATNYPLYAYYNDGAIKITNNYIYDGNGSTCYGLYINYPDATAAAPGLIANNMVAIEGMTSTTYGMRVYNGINQNIYNNSVSVSGAGTNYASYIYLSNTTSYGPYNCMNNSFANFGLNGYGLYSYGTGLAGITFSKNNIYSNSSNLCYASTTYSDISSWNTATGGDDINFDPEYLSASDLHTFSLNLNGVANPVPEVTTDFDGDPRDPINPDIGADEFELLLPANELAVNIVYTLGQLPLGAGDNHVASAIVKNMGGNTQYNVPVTLTISGSNSFTTVYTIDSITFAGTDTVHFSPFTATSLGVNDVTVSVPPDMDNSNNSASYIQEVTTNQMAYADTSEIVINLGYNTGEGLLLTKYHINGTKTISHVGAYIVGNTTLGNSLYGVVLDTLGNILSQSNPVVIDTIDQIVLFPILNPAATTTANGEVFVGIAQTIGSAGYYPLGIQEEDPARNGAYYIAGIGGGLPTHDNSFGRFTIGAVVADPAPYDAACVGIPEPAGGCGLSSAETVSIDIQNYGSSAIASGLTAYYQINNNAVVSEPVPTGTVIPSGGTYQYTFNTPANLAITVDSTFNLTAWVSLTGDLNQMNDTAWTTVNSLYQPADPTAVNTTVLYGSMATLSVLSSDSIVWWDDIMAQNPVALGASINVGPLYDTLTMWAQASGGSGVDTFHTQWNNNNGQDGNMFDITALTGNVTIDSFDVNIDASVQMEVYYKAGSFIGFESNSSAWTLAGSYYVIGNGVDVASRLPIGDVTIPYGETYAFYVTTVSGGINYFTLTAPPNITDGNLLMDNCIGKSYPFGSTFSPRLWLGNIFYSMGNGCSSAFVPVTATVVNIPPYDIGVASVNSPMSGTNLTSTEMISVEIQNWGSTGTTFFNVTYDITGAISSSVTEPMTTPVPSGSSATFDFSSTVDFSAYGIYNICVYTYLFGDGFPSNDTLCFQVVNSPPVFCSSGATSFAYEEIVQVDLSNMSNYSFPTGSGYTNYNNSVSPAVLTIGNSHPITISSDYSPGYSTNYNCWVEVYVDWDNDGVFTEPQEIAYSSAIMSSQTVSGMLTVPTTATLGLHSMRVVMEQTTSAINVFPCGYYSYGETEDYQVFIQPPFATDAGATAILSPSGGGLLENTQQPVSVVVYNFGTDTITSMDVVYTVNGMNPVLTTYTGALPAFSSDTFSLGNMIVPGGYFDLCAYTILLDDSSAMNDTTCITLFADPQYDLAMLSVDAPVDGCDLGMEDVTVTFTNLGDTVFGNIPVSYFDSTMTAVVTETYTGTVFPGDTVTYTFTTPINLAVTSEFNIYAWVGFVNDPININDTANVLVISSISPNPPAANNVTIWAGSMGTLNVLNPDTNLFYEWFDLDTNSMSTDTVFSTPVLFDTTVYYLQASASGGRALAITELSQGTPDFIEITNLSNSNFDATGWKVVTSDDYSNINDVNGTYWNLGVFAGSEVQYRQDNASNPNYWGSNLYYSTGQTGWVMLIDNNDELVDFVAWGWNLAAIQGMSPIIAGQPMTVGTQWLSNGVSSSSDVVHRVVFDNDVDADWINTSTSNMGVMNAALVGAQVGGACPSALVPVTVFVQYAQYDGAMLDMTSPVSASNMGNVSITVDIYNNGLSSLSNFQVQYVVTGYTPVFGTVAGPLAPGQTLSYTFPTPFNASTFGTYDICVKTLVTGDGYPANDEFCTSFANWDGNGESCSTAFPYLVINDPPVYQTTMHPYDRQWWRFEVPVDATNVDVSLCGSSFDTKLEVHSECPQTQFSTAAYFGYNDNSCGSQSKIHFNLMSAGVYWAKVYGYQAEFGDYVLEITGDLGDIAIVDFTVGQILCNGAANGSIETTVTPIIPPATMPITYLWSNGETGLNLYSLAPGTYTLTLTDNAGIPQIESVTITEPPALSVSLAGTDATTFGGNDGSITATVSGGVTPYTFSWSNMATTQNIASAYAGIYTLSVWDANGCNMEESITINSPVPWPPVVPTPNSHLIIVSQNSDITLDGIQAAYGSLIGVFYNSNGTMVCGGWAYWSGMATSITAYGATPGQDDGFEGAENFTWRLYEAALNVEYGGSACYISSYPNLGTYVTGGFSGINCLNVQSIIIQPIDLPVGWSIWSTYIDPIDPNMVSLFSAIHTQVTIVKSGSGQIYWPIYNLNTIGNLTMGQGYQIKMLTPQVLEVEGLLIEPTANPISLSSGWSIMGYLRTSPMNAVTVMSPVVTQVIIMKSGTGAIYWPTYNLNTIGNLMPGQGYQIKMNSQQVLTFPGNTSAPTKSDVLPVQPEKYYKVNNTGHNMSLGILEDAWNIVPQVGDEIGAFNANGELIGSAVFQKGFNAITVWGDDSHTKDRVENIANGDVFTLRLWNYTTDTEQEVVVQSWLQGNDQYGKDVIAVIEKLVVVDKEYDGFKLFQNVPNPFKDATQISFYLPEGNHVSLVVYNALGEMIEELVSARFDAGKHSVSFDTGSLPSGTYFYKFVSDGYTATKSMNINR